MAFKQSHLERWAASAVPGQRFVSYVVTATGTPAGFAVRTSGGPLIHQSGPEVGAARRRQLVERLGLDPEGGFPGWDTTFLLLTDRQLVLGTRSAARNRPKDLLHAAALDGVRIHWFDHDAGAGNRFRHLVTDFGDGRWRSDHTGLAVLGRVVATSNADRFIEALGERAIEVTDL